MSDLQECQEYWKQFRWKSDLAIHIKIVHGKVKDSQCVECMKSSTMIYHGSVKVSSERLQSFLSVAANLKIDGLSECQIFTNKKTENDIELNSLTGGYEYDIPALTIKAKRTQKESLEDTDNTRDSILEKDLNAEGILSDL